MCNFLETHNIWSFWKDLKWAGSQRRLDPARSWPIWKDFSYAHGISPLVPLVESFRGISWDTCHASVYIVQVRGSINILAISLSLLIAKPSVRGYLIIHWSNLCRHAPFLSIPCIVYCMLRTYVYLQWCTCLSEFISMVWRRTAVIPVLTGVSAVLCKALIV